VELLTLVLCVGKQDRGGGTTSSGQWHLGGAGDLSSCLKISLWLHPKDLISQHQAPADFGGFCFISGERWVQLQTAAQRVKGCRGGGRNSTALLSPQRCKWVLVKEAPVLHLKPG